MSSIHPFSEILQTLKKQGYTISFSIVELGLRHSAANEAISPNDFTVDSHYTVSGMFNPTDEVTIYAISSIKNHIKGIYISADDCIPSFLNPKIAEDYNGLSTEDFSDNSVEISSQSTVRATKRRPQGSRVLNKEMLTFDTDALIRQIKAEEAWARSDRNSLTIFKNDTLCIVLVGLHPTAAMKKHSATSAITVQVLQGEIIFETESQQSELTKGKMIALPAGIAHQVYAVNESFLLLTLAL